MYDVIKQSVGQSETDGAPNSEKAQNKETVSTAGHVCHAYLPQYDIVIQ